MEKSENHYMVDKDIINNPNDVNIMVVKTMEAEGVIVTYGEINKMNKLPKGKKSMDAT